MLAVEPGLLAWLDFRASDPAGDGWHAKAECWSFAAMMSFDLAPNVALQLSLLRNDSCNWLTAERFPYRKKKEREEPTSLQREERSFPKPTPSAACRGVPPVLPRRLQEEALFVSAVATPVAENEELYRALPGPRGRIGPPGALENGKRRAGERDGGVKRRCSGWER